MIGLESTKINIDIHESKVPLKMQPVYGEIYHDGKLLHNDKISFNCKTGEVKFDIGSSKDNFDEIFKSAGRYLPFTFKFMSHLRQMKLIHGKGWQQI